MGFRCSGFTRPGTFAVAAGPTCARTRRPATTRVAVPLSAAVVALALAGPAAADTRTGSDPDDTPGPLDIRFAGHGHDGPDVITATITTWRPFGLSALKGPNGFAVAFYRRGYPFRWVYVSGRGARLRAVVETDGGGMIGPVTVSRPTRRSLVVRMPERLLADPVSYGWVAFSAFRSAGACARTCVDAVPSSLQFPQTNTSVVAPRLHDLTAPRIRLLDFPNPSTRRSASLRYTVRFAVRDAGGAGIRSWRLERRRAGARKWARVAHGSTSGRKKIRLGSSEGAVYEHRVIALDRQGNRRTSRVAVVSVPRDDANAALLPGYAGTWKTDAAASSDFRATLHSSDDPGASFTYAFTGTYIAWIGPGTEGTARVAIDGATPTDVDLTSRTGRRLLLFETRLAAGDHTLSITVTSGVVAVDGIVVRNARAGAVGATATTATKSAPVPLSPPADQAAVSPDEEGLDCTLPETVNPLCRTGAEQRPLARGYADSWYGWPVRPLHKQHPVRSSFLDPRPAGLHFGIDISVRDDRPEAGAPPHRTHRVYAVEGGAVYNLVDGAETRCSLRKLWIGHFAYYHVDAIVGPGQQVSPGQMIGWTCKGEWHVHLSELTSSHILVNPLHPGGKLRPYADSKAPVVHSFAFFRPAPILWTAPRGAMRSPANGVRLSADRLSGIVDVRVRISDPQSFRGWLKSLPYLYADIHPYRVALRVVRLQDGVDVLSRDVSNAVFPYTRPPNNHFAPGSRANERDATCYRYRHRGLSLPVPCPGRFWLHAFAGTTTPHWDTRGVPDGRYRLRVTAWDPLGHKGSRSVEISVDNR
jgi:murein DD-endopeptidase MepM/ murein hydrolase activator NlpD